MMKLPTLNYRRSLNKSDIGTFGTKVWTTDAFYRETVDKVKRRLQQVRLL